MKKAVKAAFPHTLPVMAGYVFLGFAFGLLMRTKGYPAVYPIAMSVVIFSGALEFAAVPLLAAPFDPVGSFFLGLMLSVRHLFYGIPMLERYRGTGLRKVPLIFALTDETFSLLSVLEVPEGVEPRRFYMAVSMLDYSYWNLGTLLGAVGGGLLPFDVTGLDFALTALFLVLFLEQLKGRTGVLSGFAGLGASLLVLILFGGGNMVPLSMLLILALLLLGKGVPEHD